MRKKFNLSFVTASKQVLAFVMILCILAAALLFPVKANDNDQATFDANEDHYMILEKSPGSFETSQLKNFKLRDSDIPHFLLKGIYKNNQNNSYYCIINDSGGFDGGVHCRERLISLSDLRSIHGNSGVATIYGE